MERPRPRTRTVSGPGTSKIGPVEAVEDVGQVCGADADPVIPYHQRYRIALIHKAQTDSCLRAECT